MKPLFSGPLVFLLFLGAHFVVWRIRRPVGQYISLLALSAIVLIGSFAAFAWMATWERIPWFVPREPADYFSYVLLYVALTLAYTVTYSCVQADSPSFSILLTVDGSGAKGVDRMELETRFTDEALIIPRLNDLLTAGLARQVDRQYVITAGGAGLARVHLLYRGLMHLEKGG